ncbi:MAG: hypothetical protein ACYCY2_03060 [Acidithiobacillus ferriphilus]
MENFKIGDVVVLIGSEGLDMTVKSQDGDTVHCIWMEKKCIKEKSFERELLEKSGSGWVDVLGGISDDLLFVENFKSGDVVMFASRGDEMAVKSQDGNTVHCTWIGENSIIKEKSFEKELLVKSGSGGVWMLG